MKGNMYCSSSCSNLGWAFIKFKEQQAFSYPKDHIEKVEHTRYKLIS